MSVLPPRRRVASLAAALALFGLPGLACAAEGQPVRQRTGQVVPEAAPRVAWTAGDAVSCSRTRRKFWQDGEGWIVKTVSVCR